MFKYIAALLVGAAMILVGSSMSQAHHPDKHCCNGHRHCKRHHRHHGCCDLHHHGRRHMRHHHGCCDLHHCPHIRLLLKHLHRCHCNDCDCCHGCHKGKCDCGPCKCCDTCPGKLKNKKCCKKHLLKNNCKDGKCHLAK